MRISGNEMESTSIMNEHCSKATPSGPGEITRVAGDGLLR